MFLCYDGESIKLDTQGRQNSGLCFTNSESFKELKVKITSRSVQSLQPKGRRDGYLDEKPSPGSLLSDTTLSNQEMCSS